MQERENKKADDKLLSAIEHELERIETAEFIHGLDKDGLERKGFIGPGRIEISRSAGGLADDRTGLQFEPGIAYDRLPDEADILTQNIDTLNHIPDVSAGTLVATQEEGEKLPTRCGQNILHETKDGKERFIAAKNGKVILIGNTINIVPGDRNASVQITLSPDHLQAFAICTPAIGMGMPLTADVVHKELEKSGVKFGIQDVEIAKWVKDANTNKASTGEFIAAQGVPAVDGDDGNAEFCFESTPAEYDFKILPDGRVDYHHTCNIVMAQKDMLIATLKDATPGTNGTTVLGEITAAKAGLPSPLIAGPGVRIADNGKTFFADTSGSIVVNGSLVSVVNVFVVDGDVDYTTGNITFNGSVVVNGAVCDGFEVKAEGDIIVGKNVDSARLEAGRDIIVRGGIQGQGKGLVSAGRNIIAGYAQNARLEAQGDISVKNFAINSYIFTSKHLTMQENRGAIIGGEVFAQKGVDVRSIGSENGTKTSVTAGTDFLVKRVIGELEEAISFCETNIQKIETALKMVVKTGDDMKTLPINQRAIVQKILIKRQELCQQLDMMNAKRKDLMREAIDNDAGFIKVRTFCYADVFLKIKDFSMAIREKREAVRFYEDRKNGCIGIGAY